jgi:succinyl-CoA synthetase beta subunit
MKLHEYQAKSLFNKMGIPVPQGAVIRKTDEVKAHYEKLNSPIVVVKAQVHAGGRGKAGGVKVVKTLEEAEKETYRLLGSQLVTHQTSKEGQPVNQVYLEAGSDIDKEYYLSILLDRLQKKLCLIFSTEGGMDIEEVAEKNPNALQKFFVEQKPELNKSVLDQLTKAAGWEGKTATQGADVIQKLYQFYLKYDCSLLEINPLVLTKQGQVLPLDGKVLVDDNAAFRQPEIAAWYDKTQEDPIEVEANSYGLNYVSLDGYIGCMVNGAGLAMATMDIIQLHGGRPANFLDVGGGANADQITKAFRLILSDQRVKSVLVNIFGGIMRCDIIAEGIITAAKELDIKIPIVVRLEGTNVEKGKKMLADSGLKLNSAKNLDEGAELAVKLAQ